MPILPARPAAPDVPLRTQPSTFAARADKWLSFMGGALQTHVKGMVDFTAESLDDAEAFAAATDLSNVDITDYADDWLFVNEAGDGVEARAASSYQIATPAEAEAGEVATKVMTPLRTKQAADATAATSPWARIVTKTANNSTSLVFSGSDFDSSKYVDYQFRLRNLLPSTDGSYLTFGFSEDGGATFLSDTLTTILSPGKVGDRVLINSMVVGTGTDETGLSGFADAYNLHANKGCQFIYNVCGSNSDGQIKKETGATSLRQASQKTVDAIKFDFINSSFDHNNIASGSISLYGRRV